MKLRSLIFKVLAAQLLYVLLHMLYKWMPGDVTWFFGCPEESIFMHMKMGFFTYILVSLGQLFWLRLNKGVCPLGTSFISSRIISTVLLSYLVGALWFLAPLLLGEIQTEWVEIVYSNIILLFSLVVVVSLELDLETARYSNTTFGLLVMLFFMLAILYILATFNPPDIEIFSAHHH